jgi:hypothetical protein
LHELDAEASREHSRCLKNWQACRGNVKIELIAFFAACETLKDMPIEMDAKTAALETS